MIYGSPHPLDHRSEQIGDNADTRGPDEQVESTEQILNNYDTRENERVLPESEVRQIGCVFIVLSRLMVDRCVDFSIADLSSNFLLSVWYCFCFRTVLYFQWAISALSRTVPSRVHTNRHTSLVHGSTRIRTLLWYPGTLPSQSGCSIDLSPHVVHRVLSCIRHSV